MLTQSIALEGVAGLNWPRWKRLVSAVEELGFAGLYCSDHFILPPMPEDTDSLDVMTALTYLADHSQRLEFGPLVAPLSFRDPVLLARQAFALDSLSGGRMILGLGAGWEDREHTMFGYELGDLATRFARLQEGLEVITHLGRSVEPVSYDGRFFRLRDAWLQPRSPRPGSPRILIGGNGLRRTLPLVARYADVWNATRLTLEGFRAGSAALDALLVAGGRDPTAVKRTMMTLVVVWRDDAELARRVRWFQNVSPELAGQPPTEVLGAMRTKYRNLIDGAPEQVARQIQAYAEAGVEELMYNWFALDDLEGLRDLARNVCPFV